MLQKGGWASLKFFFHPHWNFSKTFFSLMAEYSCRERSFFCFKTFRSIGKKIFYLLSLLLKKIEIYDLKEVEKSLDEEVDDSLKMRWENFFFNILFLWFYY